MTKGIPNNPKPPTPPEVDDEDAELARLIAEDEAAKAATNAALEAEAEERAEKQRTTEAKAVLLQQAEALDMDVDDSWSVETLAEQVLAAQRAKKAATKAAFTKAANVWVFLLRDAWRVEDEKHVAGETIQVTPDIAEKWYVAGVARPGRAPV
jgi:hypothetical protein